MNEMIHRVTGLRRRLPFRMLLFSGALVAGLVALCGIKGSNLVPTATGSALPTTMAPALQAAPIPAVENDTFRLVYKNLSAVELQGTGRNGGTVNIDGTLYSFSSNIDIYPTIVPSTILFVYAYASGGTVALEVSATAPTSNKYGRYATKTGDTSRRYVGMFVTNSISTIEADAVRSVMNEGGHSLIKKLAPATALNPQTSATTWTDLYTSWNITHLFFDEERVRVWTRVMNYVSPSFTTRNCHLGVMFAGSTSVADDSESAVTINRGTAWALPFSVQQAEAYVTVVNAGTKILKAVHKSDSGLYSDFYISSTYPAAIGFEILR